MKNVAQIYLLTGLGMSLLAVGCDQATPSESTSVPEAPAMQHGPPHVTPGPQIVTSLNTLTGDVTLAEGSNVTLTQSDNTLTIAASGSSGGNTLDQAYDQGGAGTGRTIVADAGAVDISGAGGLTVAGNVGIGTTNPQARLEVAGDFIRSITRAVGFNQTDQTDDGLISTRVVAFSKKQSDTGIRVIYTDNRRCLGLACRWEILFNGASCTNPSLLAYDEFGDGVNHHSSATVVGTCFGLSAGAYTIQVRVGPSPGFSTSDAFTGFNGYWSLEVEEVR